MKPSLRRPQVSGGDPYMSPHSLPPAATAAVVTAVGDANEPRLATDVGSGNAKQMLPSVFLG